MTKSGGDVRMKPLDEHLLVSLLADRESDRVERKSSASNVSEIRRTVCAFANDLAGHGLPGVIFVGVEDDGGCAGTIIDDRLLNRLANVKDDGSVIPIPSLIVRKHVFSGCEVAVVVVEPSRSPPVRYSGRAWVRVGPTVRLASPEEEQRLSERRRSGDLPFDRRPMREASIRDLDLDCFESQYLPRAVAWDVLEDNRRSRDQQLKSLRLTVDGVPTGGALLAFGLDPQRWIAGAYVQFLRVDGTELTDPIRSQRALTGRIEDVLRRLDEIVALNIAVRTDVTTASREVRSPDYPVTALRQLAQNAVMHRSYEGTNAPVRVYWFPTAWKSIVPADSTGR